jgi:HEAT repeat protein
MTGRNFDPIGVGNIANKCPEIGERLSGPFALSLTKATNVLKATGKHDSRLMSMLGLAIKLGPHAAPATPALIELLAIQQSRMDAQLALAAIGPSAVPAVMALVRSADAKQVKLGLKTLQAMGPGARATVPELVQLIDKNPKLTLDAAEAMIDMKLDAKDAEPLLQLVLSEDSVSRRGVLRVLQSMKAPPEGVLEPALQLVRRGEWDYDVNTLCVALGERAAPGAATLLTDKEPRVRVIGGRLMRAMGKKMAPAKKELLQGLKSETAEVRAGCVYALGEIGDPATLEAIRALEQDADPKVQGAVKAAVDKF